MPVSDNRAAGRKDNEAALGSGSGEVGLEGSPALRRVLQVEAEDSSAWGGAVGARAASPEWWDRQVAPS
jgi:hypothetical protein